MQWKIRFQWYTVRADSKNQAIAKAVAAIKNDPDGFVIDAEQPEPLPNTLGGAVKMAITGKS